MIEREGGSEGEGEGVREGDIYATFEARACAHVANPQPPEFLENTVA